MTTGFYSSSVRKILAGVLLVFGAESSTVAFPPAFVETGDIAHNFTLKKHRTEELVSLSDFAGKVIFLDMFAWW